MHKQPERGKIRFKGKAAKTLPSRRSRVPTLKALQVPTRPQRGHHQTELRTAQVIAHHGKGRARWEGRLCVRTCEWSNSTLAVRGTSWPECNIKASHLKVQDLRLLWLWPTSSSECIQVKLSLCFTLFSAFHWFAAAGTRSKENKLHP